MEVDASKMDLFDCFAFPASPFSVVFNPGRDLPTCDVMISKRQVDVIIVTL